MSPSQWFEMEALLKEGLQEAKAAYESTKQEFDVAVRQLNDLGLESADGRRALHQAVVAHNHAFQNYMSAVLKFNRFILDHRCYERRETAPSGQSAYKLAV
jgi:hypothetical protein